MNYISCPLKAIIQLTLKMLMLSVLSTSVSAEDRSLETKNSHQPNQSLNLKTSLRVVNAVMPAVPPVSRTAAVYLTLQNLSDKTIILNSIETDIARHAMFHQTVEINGVAKMKHRDQLIIPAKQSLSLVAGDIHIMLMGLKDIPSSNQFQLTLGSDEQKYQVTVKVVARDID